MPDRDYRDLLGGGLLILAGLFIFIHAVTSYRLGTPRMMGPGMFPAALGVVIFVFGMLVAVPAFFRSGPVPSFELRSPLMIFASVAAFGLLIRTAGLIPAIVATTVISSLADDRFRPLSIVGLCVALSLMAWLIFRLALGLPFIMMRWPF